MVFLWCASVVDILSANALTAGPSGWGLCSTDLSPVEVHVIVDPGVSWGRRVGVNVIVDPGVPWGRRVDVIGGCVGFIVGAFSWSPCPTASGRPGSNCQSVITSDFTRFGDASFVATTLLTAACKVETTS